MRYCAVPLCKSGLASNKDGIRRHFFAVPRDETMMNKWERAIPRANWVITRKTRLCDLHFDDSFIVKTDKFVINGKNVELDRIYWKLTSDAIPTIFPNLPKYLTKKIKRRKPPKERSFKLPEKRKRVKTLSKIEEAVDTLCSSDPAPSITLEELAHHLVNPEDHAQLYPSMEWNLHYLEGEKVLTFVKMAMHEGSPQCTIVLHIDMLMKISVFVYGHRVPRYRYELNTTGELHALLVQLDKATICSGSVSSELTNGISSEASSSTHGSSTTNQHSPKCFWLLEETEGSICAACKNMSTGRRKPFSRRK